MSNPNFDYAIVSLKVHGVGADGPSQMKLLQQCGDQGWELVSILAKPDDTWFYFKQPSGGRTTSTTVATVKRFFDPTPVPLPIGER